jgi:hypothetical protein
MALKSQLADLIRKPLLVKGVSTKYLTGGIREGLVNQIMEGMSEFSCGKSDYLANGSL